MSEDREILREVWEGRIPVCFNLAGEDCNTLASPDPYYLMIPRMSYFPLVTEKVRKYFSRFLSKDIANEEMWLDYEGIPLKWNYSIGLLYDMHTGGSSLPWGLTAHFSLFPVTEIMRYPCRDALESVFLSTIKEADAFKHKGQIVTSMQKQEHKQLWTGFANDRFDQFWAINRKLMECSPDDGFKHIPFRIYMGLQPPIQRLQKPFAPDGSKITLENMLNTMLKEEQLSNFRVIIQGIEPPLETPLQWLSEHLSHPDNFLHICVHRI